MAVSISELPNLTSLGIDFYQPHLESSLKTFIHQFGLQGGGVFHDSPDWQRPQLLSHCSAPPDAGRVVTAANWQLLMAAPLFEAVPLESSPGTDYCACLCHRDGASFYYLLCWQATPLTDLQHYGITLYSRALHQQLFSTGSDWWQQTLQQVLQRTRHQLRTPLSLMLLYVGLLDNTAVEAKCQEWLKYLRATIEEMYTSLDHLTIALSGSEQQLGDYDLRQLLEQCSQAMQPWLAEKQLTLVWSPDPLWLRVDGWKMKQVLQNLLSNAIAFSPTAGQVTCEWEVFQTEVLIKIRDDGPGLSEDDLRCLGTPFYSRRPGGTGLGLAIARQIILEHKGSFWGENFPGHGAQFCMILPRLHKTE